MRKTRPDHDSTRDTVLTHRLTAAGLVLAMALTGCSGVLDGATGQQSPSAQRDVVAAITQVLDTRAKAIKGERRRLFMSTVSADDRGFRRHQAMVFANYTQLPIEVLSFRVDPSRVVKDGNGWRAVVVTTLQLRDFDRVAVARESVYSFDPETDEGVLLAAGHADDAESDSSQPWDQTPISVRSNGQVLGIFDEGSIDVAEDVLQEVTSGVRSVDKVVPREWNHKVIVYALSDTATLAALPVPGGNPEHLDAVAFPVRGAASDPVVASTRIVLHPRMLRQTHRDRGRLLRHELTHVALAEVDDDVPVWLSEGIAEWVSVRQIPVDERLISREAIAAARRSPEGMPTDADFNGAGQGANYGLAWWAVEIMVERRGTKALWRLLEQLSRASDSTRAEVLEGTVRGGEARLARLAARRIVSTYG